jgi:hypothetical protein
VPSVRVESLVCTVEVIGPSHFAGAGSAGAHRRSEAPAPDTIIGRAAADCAGARPCRATRCENASKSATPDRASLPAPFFRTFLGPYLG